METPPTHTKLNPSLRDHFWVFISAIALVLYLTGRSYRRSRLANARGLPYPPGPRPLPLIGNLMDIPKDNTSATCQALAMQYGDLVFLSAFGKHVLFINSFETAHELFDKRSANYSDRSESTMANELMGWSFSFGHMPYGDRWRAHRRMFHRQFQQSMASTHWGIQTKEAHFLIRNLLREPTELEYHLRHNAAAVIMGMTYGIDVQYKNDRYVAVAEKALEGMGQAASPGAFLVDLLPILKYVPEWFPGATFQKKAKDWGGAVCEMREAPFATAVQKIKHGTATPSFVSNMLAELGTSGDNNIGEDQLEIVKNCAGLSYAAGAESTVSTIASFVLAIVTHPGVLSKAHEEIDRVVGNDRLPEFTDRPSLPYVDAVLKETLRWNPVAPLGLPHMVTRDDEYNGCFIPAGTNVVGNSWGILHDPRVFPNPTKFEPERFLENSLDKNANPAHLTPTERLSSAFGYGRRLCPGRFVGEAQVWIAIACILSVFDISPPLDDNGEPIPVTPAFSSGMICHPLPFDFVMKPRSAKAKALIEQTEVQ